MAARTLTRKNSRTEKTSLPTPTRRTSARRSSGVDPEFRQRLATPIEYVWSPEFEQPELVDEILEDCPAVSAAGLPRAPRDTPPYLAALYKIPLLTPRQEFVLFRQMNFWKHRAEALRGKMLEAGVTPARRRRFEEHLAAALRLRNQIVEANLRLVVSIAKTLVDDINRLEDLISDGNVPLVRAVEIFDFTRGLRFSTYATWAIRNCLFRSTPRNRKVAQRFRTGTEMAFLEAASGDAGVERHEPDEVPVPKMISRWLNELPERDRTIVEARFGLGIHRRPAKFREIAERLQVSTERARQLLTRALARLRKTAGESHSETYSQLCT